MLLGLAAVGLAMAPHPARAASPAVSCQGERKFETLRDAFISQQGATPAAAATMILPADGEARFLFQQPAGSDGDARSFRVFEVEGLNASTLTGEELKVVSVDPAKGETGGQFKPTDSVSLRTDIAPRFPSWLIRSFVVVACQGPKFSGWGQATAPVSDPAVTLPICIGTGVLVYLLGMSAVFAQRRKPSSLEAKYPAIFGARPLRWWDAANPIHLMANAFNQGSVQKAQVLLFSFLIGELVLSLVLRTGALVDLSPTVVGLLGISGIGAAAAQIAYQQKTRLSFENWAWLENRHVLQTPPPAASGGPHWRELVLTNREFDVYKLQTIIFTIAVASALLVDGASQLSNFSVPGSLLGVLGLSQVVYVGGVLVKPPAVADLDNAITRLRAAGETVAAAKIQNTDTDANGKLLPGPIFPPAVNAQRQYDDLADNVVPMIESALEVPADRSRL